MNLKLYNINLLKKAKTTLKKIVDKSDCKIEEDHYHFYANGTTKILLKSEKEYVGNYKKLDSYVKASKELDDEIDFMNKNNLARLEDNIEFIQKYMEKQEEDYLYEYEYYEDEIAYYLNHNSRITFSNKETITQIDANGLSLRKTIPTTPVFKKVAKKAYSKDENVINKTGVEKLFRPIYTFQKRKSDNSLETEKKSVYSLDELPEEYKYYDRDNFCSKICEEKEKEKTLNK